MKKVYTYDPSNISQNGKDRMRFELGDTMVDGGEDTAYLTDEEITAVLNLYPSKWKKAKLALVESVYRRFSGEVDTKVGPLSLGLDSRKETWKEMYKELKAEIPPPIPNANKSQQSDPYFYAGMMDN